MKPNEAVALVAVILSVCGSIVSFRYACRRQGHDKYYRIYAGVILAYFAIIYILAFGVSFGEWFGESPLLYYLIRSGTLTMAGVVMLIGLLIGWVIHE